ncbi:MAG: hypothetical protein WBP80_02090 [Planifilum fulgidum]
MNIAELLTYTDIDQLNRIRRTYGFEGSVHSKNELIRTLLFHLGGRRELSEQIRSCDAVQNRFLQLVFFDLRDVFSMEELLGKAKAAFGQEEGDLRSLILWLLKRGWLFPGVTPRTRHLYQVPGDLKEKINRLFAEEYLEDAVEEPVVYRDEQGMLARDLHRFLSFVMHNDVPLTAEGAIYRQHQRKLFKSFIVPEKPVDKKGWRFGFGRRYHLYPDRFSLIYDYAYYQGYITEEETGWIRLTEKGAGKILNDETESSQEIYRFWLRLYRKPVPHLPVVVRWIDLLARGRWTSVGVISKAVADWIESYYYETEETLLRRILKMMMHLGVVRMGEGADGKELVSVTEEGHALITGVSGFSEEGLDDRFSNPLFGKRLV